MKKQTGTKLFAFQLAEKTEKKSTKEKWTARKGVATAGCSGPDARGSHRYYGSDQGIWC